ncbi:type III secretion system translocon subunit SctE [Klebsiella sp. RIT-PI-d]|uniref:type III secretion system translocon subunit SctE n=1 Tax=Klebsiella sp. RIT-PI-d TaxID=1681196 RepID=UPI000AB842B0|nr:type III secretion system translocon subunit SctE [Klebsiella sp. RIT-PI-d]
MNGITNNPLPRSAYLNNIDGQVKSTEAKTEAVKLSNDQMDAARKIVESKVITQFEKSQNNGDTLKPSLRAPSSSKTPLSASAQTTSNGGSEIEKKGAMETYNELMANLITLLGDQSIDELQARAEMYTKYSKDHGTATNAVIEQVEVEESAYNAAKTAQASASQDVTSLESQVFMQQQQIQTLQQSKAEIEEKLNDPDISPADKEDLSAQLNNINQQISQKQASLNYLQSNLILAQQKLDLATSNVSSKSAELQQSLNYLGSLNKNAASVNDSFDKSLKTNAGATAYLMAQLITIIGESTEETMEMNLKFSQKVQAAQQEKLHEDTLEVERQQEKSKHMQETMGCIGKIIGAIVTVVASIAAVFTGGASMIALAAIGAAIMTADTIYQKVTGNESFVAAALKPIVEHVLMPIIQLITDAISTVLESLGIKNDIAEIIATVLAVVVLIIGAVAASVALKKLPIDKIMNVVGSVLNKVFKTVISAVTKAVKPIASGLKSITDDVAKKLSKIMDSLSAALNQLVGNQAKSKINVMKQFFNNEAKVKSLGNVFNLAEEILRLINVSIDAAAGIASGAIEKKVSYKLADITRELADSATMKRYTDSVTETFSDSMENLNMFATSTADMAGDNMKAGQFILSNTKV